ncbi:MAG: sigma-70 family RNA polymerase sigma factor [Bacteroidales bacterium]|nr:sigma-70 family RNA polymerase sigma factor [Bacteroidales bacterium]
MTQIIDTYKIRQGNREEFRRVVDNNMDRVYSIALKITADKEDAGDITQDTFVKLWEKRKSLRSGENIEGYISKIVINKSYDLLRRRKRQDSCTNDSDLFVNLISEDEADRELNYKEIAEAIEMLCNGLSPKQQLVFTLVEIEQMSHDEVRDATGMTKNSIKSNLSHAKQRVEAGLKKYLK